MDKETKNIINKMCKRVINELNGLTTNELVLQNFEQQYFRLIKALIELQELFDLELFDKIRKHGVVKVEGYPDFFLNVENPILLSEMLRVFMMALNRIFGDADDNDNSVVALSDGALQRWLSKLYK